MIIEEEEPKGDLNPDALEAFVDEEVIIEEEEIVTFKEDEEDEDADEIDIAFAANDEGYW